MIIYIEDGEAAALLASLQDQDLMLSQAEDNVWVVRRAPDFNAPPPFPPEPPEVSEPEPWEIMRDLPPEVWATIVGGSVIVAIAIYAIFRALGLIR